MELHAKSLNLESVNTESLVIGFYQDKDPDFSNLKLSKDLEKKLTQEITKRKIDAKLGQAVTLFEQNSVNVKKLILISLGKKKDFNKNKVQSLIKSLMSKLNKYKITSSSFLFSYDKQVNFESINRVILDEVLAFNYSFDNYRTKKEAIVKKHLKKLNILFLEAKQEKDLKTAIDRAKSISIGKELTKLVANLPPNVCNPKFLSLEAKKLDKKYKTIKTTVLGQKELTKLKMGSYLAVGQGSENESIMSVIEYKGAKDKKDAPVVLVGKGITFDTGGISIKPSSNMDEMKYDMCGAASVLGVMKAVAELGLEINLVGILAAAENMPDGTSYRPGDILTSMSGQTIEIINTDAEGRLVLCDALTYAKKFKPKTVIDIATLTGACVVALGSLAAGVMGNDDKLVKSLVDAGEQTHDRAWQLPLWSEYHQDLESPFADMRNCGSREAGSITAGCFLAKFCEDYTWAHIDIAGVASTSGKTMQATGRPVSLLVQYLINQA